MDVAELLQQKMDGSVQAEHDDHLSAPFLFQIETRPIAIVLSRELVSKYVDIDELVKLCDIARKQLNEELGIPVPELTIELSDSLSQASYKVCLYSCPILQAELLLDHVAVLGDVDHCKLLGIPVKSIVSTALCEDMVWVQAKYKTFLRERQMKVLESTQVIKLHFLFVLYQHACQLVGIEESKRILNLCEKLYPELVKELYRQLPIQKVAEIFQRLVREGVSLKPMRIILETLVHWASREKNALLLTEYVRVGLNRVISYTYAPNNVLPAYVFDQELEEYIRGSIRQSQLGNYLDLEPEETADVVRAIVGCVGGVRIMGPRPALVVALDIRCYVRKLIENELYGLPVLSFQELVSSVKMKQLGLISLREPTELESIETQAAFNSVACDDVEVSL